MRSREKVSAVSVSLENSKTDCSWRTRREKSRQFRLALRLASLRCWLISLLAGFCWKAPRDSYDFGWAALAAVGEFEPARFWGLPSPGYLLGFAMCIPCILLFMY